MKMVKQAIQTPDGTILESNHRHDYVTYEDKVSGEIYMIDGGIDYCRRSVNHVPAIDVSVYLEDGIEAVRENVTWGTRGKNGDEPMRRIKLCDMDMGHIEACLATQKNMHPTIREAFIMELQYRGEHEIADEYQ
jgi:hypothetical protein